MKKVIYLSSIFCSLFLCAKAQTAWEFNGGTAPAGWLMVNYQGSGNFSSGSWNLITPATPQTAYIRYQVAAASSQINTTTFRFVKINLRNETPQTSARFYFWYNGIPAFIPFNLQPNADYTEYTIDLAGSDAFTGNGPTAVNIGKKWTYNVSDAGTYANMPFIRFDVPSVVPPAAGAGVQAASVNKLISVDYVRFAASMTPVINLAAPVTVTSNSAAFNAQVTSDGGASVTERGLVWSTSVDFTPMYKVRQGTGAGSFSQSLTDLAPGTAYYVKAYAQNSAGTAYSPAQSFNTNLADSTSNLIGLTLSNGVTLGESFNANKTSYTTTVPGTLSGVTVTPVVYNSNATVKVNNVTVANNTASGTIALLPGVNVIEVQVTNTVSATTKTYLVRLNVEAQYGWEFTATSMPAGWSQTNFQTSSFSGGCWNLITPLTPTPAFVRFQTSASLSEISTTTYRYIKIRLKNGTAQNSGRFYFPYGSANVFIPFTIQPFSDYTDYVIDLAGSDAFSGNVGNLVNVGKKWTYNAGDPLTLSKMTSIRFDVPGTIPPDAGFGVQYGSLNLPVGIDYIRLLSVSSPAGVVTAVPSGITQLPSVVLEGTVNADGGAAITERGIVWAENANPTIADNKLQMGSGTGTFLQTLSGFNNGTVYFARAYAINANGITYGNTVTFISKTIPQQLTTAAPQMITDTCLKVGGAVGKDGGAMVTDRGIVWAETPMPTVANNKINLCSGAGAFSGNTIFVPGKTYYVRTYAVNSEGIAYGNEQVFAIPDSNAVMRTIMPEGQYDINRPEWKTAGVSISKNGDNGVTIYPNPVTTTATIKVVGNKLMNTKANIIDLYGRKIQVIHLTTSETWLDMTSQQAGIYFLRLADGSSVSILKVK